MSMSLIQKILFPGIAPILRKQILSLPLHQRVKAFVDHPAGPLTIHFWAPTFKWGISIANLADLNRPAEKVSVEQQTAVTTTGVIWSRYSMVIRPKNWNLFSVNIFMACTGLYQLFRVNQYRSSQKQAVTT